MTRRSTWRQHDVTRAMKAAKAGGEAVARVEILPDGRIVIVTTNAPDAAAQNPCDELFRR